MKLTQLVSTARGALMTLHLSVWWGSYRIRRWLGLVVHPIFLLGDKGVAEVKCPYSQVVYPEVPPYYMAQMQGLMEITQRDYCEFVVWTPDVMAVTRIDRSKEYWDWLHLRLADFWCWVVAQVEPPREKKSQPPKLELTATTLYKLKD